MARLVAPLLLLVGLVNLVPVSGVLSAARLEALYGVSIEGESLLLLMRHRAVLFGIVGGLLVAGALHRPLRAAAMICGLVSMLSFVALAGLAASPGPILERIAWIDVGASLLLVVAWILDRRYGPDTP